MNKTILIEGMGCSGCENRVKKALEALPQVESAQVSKDSGTCRGHCERARCRGYSDADCLLRRQIHGNGNPLRR